MPGAGPKALWVVLAFAIAVTLAPAQPGGTVRNGAKNGMFTELFFEPETPPVSLKTAPIWNELEQLLDNPYAVTTVCNDAAGPVPGNGEFEFGIQVLSNWPSYCSTIVRRPSFGGVVLPPLLVHPLNYNPTTGTEMRLINSQFPGGGFNNTSICTCMPTANQFPGSPYMTCTTLPKPFLGIGTSNLGCRPNQGSVIQVSPGASRLPPGSDADIDYNTAYAGERAIAARLNPAMPTVAAADSAEAKKIFRKRCTACHTFGKGIKVGPDLKGVTDRRNRDWLLKFIRSSSTVIQSGDPAAVKLFAEFKRERMPDWGDLTPQQAGAVLDYFAANGPEQKEPDERNASSATTAEISMGRQLFHGEARLTYGGQACRTCHSIHEPDRVGAGSLGPDLTRTYHKFQDKALTDFLRRPCVLREPELSTKNYLTPQESFDLKAYLAKVAGAL